MIGEYQHVLDMVLDFATIFGVAAFLLRNSWNQKENLRLNREIRDDVQEIKVRQEERKNDKVH